VRDVPLTYLDDAAFDAQYAASVPVAEDVRRRITSGWIAFGFVAGGDGGFGATSRTTAFSGFYDPALGRVFLRAKRPASAFAGDAGPPDERDDAALVVHELTHALQDQAFGLPKFAQADDDDAMLARKATYEGDATMVAEVFGATQANESLGDAILRASERARTLPEEDVVKWIGADGSLVERPAIGWRPLVFAYYGGLSFLSGVRPPYDFRAIDGVFRDPPTTTEQVLHPEKYVAREARLPLADPPAPAGSTWTTTGTLGEYRTRLLLARCAPRDVAARAAAGWGADRYAVGALPGDKLALAWITRWDTPADAEEFERALATTSRCFPSPPRSGVHIGTEDGIARVGDRVAYVRGVTGAAALAKSLATP
jgi:hypothetical protein